MKDFEVNIESFNIESKSECSKCGITLKTGKTICERCENSKIFLEEMHIFCADSIKDKMFKLIEDVNQKVPLPGIGQEIRIRSQVSINMLSIVLKMLRINGKIEELVISTYSFDKSSIEVIFGLFKNGIIEKLNFLISDTYSYRYKNQYDQIISLVLGFQADGFNVGLCFATTHLKITLVQCAGNYYHIEGSMNYSINNLCEQIIIENDKKIYDFDHNLLCNVIPKKENKALQVIGKPYGRMKG